MSGDDGINAAFVIAYLERTEDEVRAAVRDARDAVEDVKRDLVDERIANQRLSDRLDGVTGRLDDVLARVSQLEPVVERVRGEHERSDRASAGWGDRIRDSVWQAVIFFLVLVLGLAVTGLGARLRGWITPSVDAGEREAGVEDPNR